MNFVSDAVFMGCEVKEWKGEKGLRKWVAARFADAETGAVLEMNGNIDLESVLKSYKVFDRVRVFAAIKPRQQGGFYADVMAVSPMK